MHSHMKAMNQSKNADQECRIESLRDLFYRLTANVKDATEQETSEILSEPEVAWPEIAEKPPKPPSLGRAPMRSRGVSEHAL